MSSAYRGYAIGSSNVGFPLFSDKMLLAASCECRWNDPRVSVVMLEFSYVRCCNVMRIIGKWASIVVVYLQVERRRYETRTAAQDIADIAT
jgi:hypothetical protein